MPARFRADASLVLRFGYSLTPAIAALTVARRSAAETPVVTPWRASMETVKLVPWSRSVSLTISGSELDRDYLATWAETLDVAGLWRDAFAEGDGRAWLGRLIDLLRPRAKRLTDFIDKGRPFLADAIEYDAEAVAKQYAIAITPAMAGLIERDDHYIQGEKSFGYRIGAKYAKPIDVRLVAATNKDLEALVKAGADMLLFETCQDLLQIKIALVSCFGTLERMKRDIPVMVSITIENTGTMLVGTDVAAALAAIEPFPVFSIGLNCATGPEGMTSHLRYLCRHYRGRVSCIPNAGIPQVRDGKTHYPLSPEAFAAQLSAFVRDEGVSIVGGCCGTTPEHIRALRDALDGVAPAARAVSWKPALGSLYQAAEIRQEIPPFLIGERCNANGFGFRRSASSRFS